MKKRYKFISWNVNGVRAVDKKEALKWVDEHDIHILGLQETKSMKNQIPKTIFNKEFKFLTASESAIKGRSGTALFSDIDISFECNCP
ncbi:MAG: endonuclease/exonuclease/phosphatase family protein, partial [Aliarcobacter sp.]